jgi:hypothetical protein
VKTDLGPNFKVLGQDSFLLMPNVISMCLVVAPFVVVMIGFTISSAIMKYFKQHCIPDDWFVLFKTVLFMQFGLTSLTMVYNLFDTGYQTALSLLFLSLLFGVLPIYTFTRNLLLNKLPGRQLISYFQRAGTLFCIVFLRRHETYQILALYAIQLLALAFQFPAFSFKPTPTATCKYSHKFRYSELNYSWSHRLVSAMLPMLAFMIPFDRSGFGTISVSGVIILFSSIKHLIIDEFVTEPIHQLLQKPLEEEKKVEKPSVCCTCFKRCRRENPDQDKEEDVPKVDQAFDQELIRE